MLKTNSKDNEMQNANSSNDTERLDYLEQHEFQQAPHDTWGVAHWVKSRDGKWAIAPTLRDAVDKAMALSAAAVS